MINQKENIVSKEEYDQIKLSYLNHEDRPNFKDRFEPRIVKPNTKTEDKELLYKEMSPINYLVGHLK